MVDLKRSGVELHGISFLLKRPVTKSSALTAMLTESSRKSQVTRTLEEKDFLSLFIDEGLI